MYNDYRQGYMNRVNTVKDARSVVSCSSSYRETKRWVFDDIPAGSSVLDYGCGNGTFGDFETRNDLVVVGYDIDRLNKVAMYHDLDEIKGVFDVIVMSHVVEHQSDEEVRASLYWAGKHCKRLYITTPNAELNPFVPFHCDSTHVKPMNHGEFPVWCIEAGFDRVHVVWSGIPKLPWYQLASRIVFSKLVGVSIFDEYCVVASKVI